MRGMRTDFLDLEQIEIYHEAGGREIYALNLCLGDFDTAFPSAKQWNDVDEQMKAF